MNIIFFNNPVGTKKLNSIITDDTVETLKNNGIIPNDSVVLIKPYSTELSFADRAILTHIDKTVFDDYSNPTQILFDADLLKMFFLDLYRSARSEIFVVLDALQLRAIASNKPDILQMIEQDKNILRNLPEDVLNKMDGLTDFFEINKIIPAELLVDYKEKYGYMLK